MSYLSNLTHHFIFQVCAHRYIRQAPDYRWGRGLCYTLTNRLELDEAVEPCKGRPTDR